MEKQRTIAELWDRFRAIKNRFGSDNDYPRLITLSNWQNPAQGRIDWVTEIKSLRAELLERCKRVHENVNDYTDFEIRKIGANLYVYADNRRDFSRLDTAGTALDMSAAYAFWAWELEQREKEAGE